MSDQYTPTTVEVREAYADAHCPDLYVVHGDSCPADPEFNRWLASVKAEAWDEGRESVTFGVRSGQATEIRVRHTPNPYRTEDAP